MNVSAGFNDEWSGGIFRNPMSFLFENLVIILELNGGSLSEI